MNTMEIIKTVAICAVILGWAIINLITALRLSAKQMTGRYVKSCRKNLVGLIATNAFYALAWAIKGGKFITLYVIAAIKSMKGKTEGITARV